MLSLTGLERQLIVQSELRWENIWTLAACNEIRESGLVGFYNSLEGKSCKR